MTKLSHWMYAHDFTAREAAFLILGIDPSSNDADAHNASHIKKRLCEAYENAVTAFCKQTGVELQYDFCDQFEDLSEVKERVCAPDEEQLWSVELEDARDKLLGASKATEYSWFVRPCPFYAARFSRKNLAKWLLENHLESKYQFTDVRLSRPRHTTHLIAKFEEANHKFWTLFDPTDPSTAPTNVAVTAWLINEGVAKRTAEVMASMLRADGLPVGRR